MKYVKYNLIWKKDGEGEQPYTTLSSMGVTFEGGVVVNSQNEYFGYLDGADAECTAAIAACEAFNMIALTQTQALAFVQDAVPLNTEHIVPPLGTTVYSGAPYVGADSKICIPWNKTKS